MSNDRNQPPTPPVPGYSQGPPIGHGEAKAQAKAAKAYAKAQRPWFKKKRFIGLGVLVLIVIAIIANSGGGSKSTPKTTTAASATRQGTNETPGTTPPGSSAGSALPIQSGDWRLDSVRPKDDGLGHFSVDARITYTGSASNGGTNLFTLTIFKAGKEIAVLNGSASSVPAGKATTVQFISSDKFVVGPYTFDFQKDL